MLAPGLKRFDNPLQIFFSRPVKQRFDAFLKVCSKKSPRGAKGRCEGHVFFRCAPDMRQKNKDTTATLTDQGQDDFSEVVPHHDSLGAEIKICREGLGSGRRQEKTELFAAGLKKKARSDLVSTSSFLILGLRRRVQQCCCRHPNDIPRWLFAPTASLPSTLVSSSTRNLTMFTSLPSATSRANAASLIEAILPESDWFFGRWLRAARYKPVGKPGADQAATVKQVRNRVPRQSAVRNRIVFPPISVLDRETRSGGTKASQSG